MHKDKSREWQVSAQAYLMRLALGDWRAQGSPIPNKRGGKRFCPTEYHRELCRLLGQNDEEGFKALKLEQGYATTIGV